MPSTVYPVSCLYCLGLLKILLGSMQYLKQSGTFFKCLTFLMFIFCAVIEFSSIFLLPLVSLFLLSTLFFLTIRKLWINSLLGFNLFFGICKVNTQNIITFHYRIYMLLVMLVYYLRAIRYSFENSIFDYWSHYIAIIALASSILAWIVIGRFFLAKLFYSALNYEFLFTSFCVLASFLLKFSFHQEIQSIMLICACVSIMLIALVSGIAFKLLSNEDYVS